MENWGLVTCRERLLADDRSPISSRQLVALHELAHQWFGNSVGMFRVDNKLGWITVLCR